MEEQRFNRLGPLGLARVHPGMVIGHHLLLLLLFPRQRWEVPAVRRWKAWYQMYLTAFVHQLDTGVKILLWVVCGDSGGSRKAGKCCRGVLWSWQWHDLRRRRRGRRIRWGCEAIWRHALHIWGGVWGEELMMGSWCWLIQVGEGAAVLQGQTDVICIDLLPDLLGVAWRSVAVKVTQVNVDFIQVPLLKVGVRGGRYRKWQKGRT